MVSYPQNENGTTYLGKHLILDFYNAKDLTNLKHIENACNAAAIASGATIIKSMFHHFGENDGVSGIILLAESHLSIHTWPEFNIATFDIYVCGNCDPEEAMKVLEMYFYPTAVKKTLLERGLID